MRRRRNWGRFETEEADLTSEIWSLGIYIGGEEEESDFRGGNRRIKGRQQ
jgi:hypothetical protein